MALQTRQSPWPSVPSSHYACPRGLHLPLPPPSWGAPGTACLSRLGAQVGAAPSALLCDACVPGHGLSAAASGLTPRMKSSRSLGSTSASITRNACNARAGAAHQPCPAQGHPEAGQAGELGGGDAAPPGPREGKLTLTQMDRRFPRAIRFPRQSKQRWLKRNWVLRRNGDRYSGRGGGWGGNTRAQKHTCWQASPAHLASGNALRHTRASTHDVHHTLLCNSKGEPETTQTATDSLRKTQQNVTQARKAQGLP